MNKGLKKTIGWMKFLIIAGMSLKEGETLQIVDDSVFKDMNASAIMQIVEKQSNFKIVVEGLKAEVRDSEGLKVLDFELSSEEELLKFPNAIEKANYIVDNPLRDVRKAIIGNTAFKETFDEMTDLPVKFERLKDDTDLLYKIEGADKLIELVTALSGGSLETLGKEKSEDGTLVKMIDTEEGKYVEGKITDVLAEALMKCGLSKKTVNELINNVETLEEMETGEDDAVIGDAGEVKEKIYTQEIEDIVEVDENGNIKVEDPELFDGAEASDVEVLALIESELKDFDEISSNGFGRIEGSEATTQSEKVVDFLRDAVRRGTITKEELNDYYSAVLAAKQGKTCGVAKKYEREIRREIKEYNYRTGRKIRDTEEFLDEMEAEEIRIEEEMEKQDEAIEDAKSKFDRLNESTIKQSIKGIKMSKEDSELFAATQLNVEIQERKGDEIIEKLDEQERITEKVRFSYAFACLAEDMSLYKKEQERTIKKEIIHRVTPYMESVSETQKENERILNATDEEVKQTASIIKDINAMFYGDDEEEDGLVAPGIISAASDNAIDTISEGVKMTHDENETSSENGEDIDL